MARPAKEGLDYFPIDTDMDQEDKVAFIESKYGLQGFAILIRLLMRIYKNGYFYLWAEREQYLFCKSINVDINTVLAVVNECINEGFFNKNLYKSYSILTSHGIQKRFLKGTERRKSVVMVKEYYLIEPTDDVKIDNVTLTSINVNNNSINVNVTSTFSTQSKVKESKVKENILDSNAREEDRVVDNVDNFLNDTTDDLYPSGNAAEETAATLADDSDQSLESSGDFMSFWNAYPKRSGMPKAMEAWKSLTDKGFKPEFLVMAARRYAIRIIADKTETKFIKMPHNFLLEGAFYNYLPRNLPQCPRCHGTGSYDVEEDDGLRVAICDCRKILFPNFTAAV